MTEAEWLAGEEPSKMFGHPARRSSDRKWRLFVCACCRRIMSLMPDARSHASVEASEGFADGLITREQLRRAWAGAHDAALAWYPGGEGTPDSCASASAVALDVASSSEPSTGIPAQAAAAAGFAEGEGAAPHDAGPVADWTASLEAAEQARLFRDIFGNPFRPVVFDPAWRTSTAVALAGQMYESRDFGAMPILADALQDAGCDNEDVLNHCRDPNQTHVRGCWVVDRVLGKV